MNQKGLTNISLAVIAAIIAISGYFVFSKNRSTFPPYSITPDNTFSTNIDGYFETCMDNAAIYKHLNGNWTKASNKLPGKGLYYLDDKFFGYGMCDVVYCTDLPKPYTLKLVEYRKISEKAPPSDSGSTASTLPAYQTVPLSGDIKINIQYFNDKNCQNKEAVSAVIKR